MAKRAAPVVISHLRAGGKLDFSPRRRKHSFTRFLQSRARRGVRVARHNREGAGADQRGFEYGVNYQPDWLKLVKVTPLATSRTNSCNITKSS